METFFNSLHSFIAGFALALGFINLVAGLHKEGDRIYLLFGLIGLGVAGYFYLPGLLSVEDNFSPAGKFSFSFVYLFYGLFPWFFSAYTGFQRPRLCIALNVVALASFMVFILTPSSDQAILLDGKWPLWNMLGHLYLIGVGVFGLLASLHQMKTLQSALPRAFFSVIIIYNLLLLNELFGYYLKIQLLLPHSFAGFATLDFIPVFFMLIMGIRMADDTYDRIRFERAYQLKDQQWQTLLEKMKFLVTVVDRRGRLTYVNPYFLELTGYTFQEVIGREWFRQFLPPKKAKEARKSFNKMIEEAVEFPESQGVLRLASGECKVLTWSTVALVGHEGQRTGFISIGADITDKEQALLAVKELQSELEKENLHCYTCISSGWEKANLRMTLTP